MVPFLDAVLHGCVTSGWEESAPVVSRNGECADEIRTKRRDEFRQDYELFREFANEELDVLLPIPRLRAKGHSLPTPVVRDRVSRLLELYRAIQGELIHELTEYYNASIRDNSKPYVLHFGEGLTPNYTAVSEETSHVDHA